MNKTQEVFLAFILLIGSLLAGSSLASTFVSVGAPLPTLSISGQLSFSAKTDKGIEKSLTEAQGKSPALVYFFAVDCNHCANVLRTRGSLFEDAAKQDFKPIGVSALGPNFGISQLALISEQFQLPSPVFGDVDDKICGKYGVGEFTIFLLDEEGNIYFRQQIGQKLNEVLTQEIIEHAKNTILAKKNQTPASQEPDEFAGTIIDGRKNLYRPLVALLALTLLTVSLIVLAKTTDSWLPPLAGITLLATYLVSGSWLYTPANILVIIAAIVLIKKTKQASIIALAVCSIASASLCLPTFNEIPRLQSVGLQTAFWYLVPQILVSLLMYEIAFAMQKQKYQKQVYETAIPAPTNYAGKITVVKEFKAERCDICHQTDLFNVQTGYCSRCQQNTIS